MSPYANNIPVTGYFRAHRFGPLPFISGLNIGSCYLAGQALWFREGKFYSMLGGDGVGVEFRAGDPMIVGLGKMLAKKMRAPALAGFEFPASASKTADFFRYLIRLNVGLLEAAAQTGTTVRYKSQDGKRFRTVEQMMLDNEVVAARNQAMQPGVMLL